MAGDILTDKAFLIILKDLWGKSTYPGDVTSVENKTNYDSKNHTAKSKFKAGKNVSHVFLNIMIAMRQLIDWDIQTSFKSGSNTMGEWVFGEYYTH